MLRSKLLTGFVTLFALFFAAVIQAKHPEEVPGPPSKQALTEKKNGLPPDWLSQAQKEIVQHEYHASRNNEGKLQAPNRQQNFRTYFSSGGVRLTQRTGVQPEELLGLRYLGIGREGMLAPSENSADQPPHVEDNRVSIIHADGVTEWYVNEKQGLEQGFTITSAPAGDGVVEMRLQIDAKQIRVSATAVDITTKSGRELKYDHLKVIDSNGRVLPARFQLIAGDRLAILVDDSTAHYPMTIDPLISGNNYLLLESDQASAQFGESVASAGDVNQDGYDDVVVGAPYYDAGKADNGAVFVYYGSSSGLSSSPSLILPGSNTSDRFGTSVDGAGDVDNDGFSDVIVGIPGYDDGSMADSGGGKIFFGSAAGLSLTDHSALNNCADAAGQHFGEHVAGIGDVNGDGLSDFMIGTSIYGGQRGRVCLFKGFHNRIFYAAQRIDGSSSGAYFGYDFDGIGDINGDGYDDVIIGAYGFSHPQTHEGAAYIYLGSAGVLVSGRILESDIATAGFGSSVAGIGDVNGDGKPDIAIGGAALNSGGTLEDSVYVYFGLGGGDFSLHRILNVNQPGSRFGDSVSAGDINGDGYADLVVGAMYYTNGTTNEGGTFIYLGGVSGLSAAADYALESNQDFAYFGSSVASAGDVNGDGYSDVIVGAYNYDNNQIDEGAAFVYYGGAASLPQAPNKILDGTKVDSDFGVSVASAGDVNGDGYSDVIIGADTYDSGAGNEGAAFYYLGSSSGLALTPTASLSSTPQQDSYFGTSVASAGDVNGDGYDDVVVSSYKTSDFIGGAVHLYLGTATGLSTSAKQTVGITQSFASFGRSVASAGDVNADGYADLVVGAYHYDYSDTEFDAGAAFVYLGGPLGYTPNPQRMITVPQRVSYLGYSVSSAGDVNGDGYSDVLVGAYKYTKDQVGEGVAFLYHGGKDGLATSPTVILDSNQANANFGIAVSSAGDVNKDGYDDVVVGASRYLNSQSKEGAAFLYFGGASGVSSVPGAVLESTQNNSNFGESVSSAGDVDGDGFADFLIGASGYSDPLASEGGAFLYHGQPVWFFPPSPVVLEGNKAFANFGSSVASAGDVNGDGFSDVIVGAPSYQNSSSQTVGAAYLFYGNGGGTGRSVRVKQANTGGRGIAANGTLWESEYLDISMNAVSFTGRARVKLEAELCPSGKAFGDATCLILSGSSWSDTGGDGEILLTEKFTPPVKGSYHWRVRVLYTPYHLVTSGIIGRAYPSHGPWRRLYGQASTLDVRARFDSITCSASSLTVPAGDIGDARLYRAGTTLNTNGNVNLLSGSDVVFEAGSSVQLNPGFHPATGSRFSGDIHSVNCGTARPAVTANALVRADTSEAMPQVTEKTAGIRSDGGLFTPPEMQWMHFADLPSGLMLLLSEKGVTEKDLTDLQSSASGDQILFATKIALTGQDGNGLSDVYRYQVTDQSLHLVSATVSGRAGNGASDQPRIDGWGGFIVYRTEASDLLDTKDLNGVSDILLQNIQWGETTRISMAVDGEGSQQASANPSISGFRPSVVYDRVTDSGWGVFLYDQQTGLTERIDEGLCGAHHPQISADGQVIAYWCDTAGRADCTIERLNLSNMTRSSSACPVDVVPGEFDLLH